MRLTDLEGLSHAARRSNSALFQGITLPHRRRLDARGIRWFYPTVWISKIQIGVIFGTRAGNREGDRKAIEHDGYVTVDDIGYLDDEGYLYVSDRRTDLVLSGGVNIYPAEIEQVLIGMPGVADCAVFGIPDAEFGQSLVAAVQTHGPTMLTAQQVQDFLAKKLANFKVPRIIEFRDNLPREDTGKIFKRRLKEEYTARQCS